MHTCYLAPRCWQYCVSDSKWGLQQGSDLAVQQRFDDKDPSFPLGILLKASHHLLLAFFPWCILVSCFPQASRTHRPPSSLRSRALVNLPEPATGSPAFPLLTDTAYQQHPTTAALVEVPQFSSSNSLQSFRLSIFPSSNITWMGWWKYFGWSNCSRQRIENI